LPFPSASSVSNKTITRVSTRQIRIAQVLGAICLHEAAKTLLIRKTQAQAQAIAYRLTRREGLYKAFIEALPALEDMANREAIDVLQAFSEAARQEFHRPGV
jgi:hypothetical protein